MNVRHIIQKSLQMIVVAALFASCDMMKEDRDDCPTGLYVNFVYDYNIQRADMFKDHVGSVTLYVFDESDKLVAQRTVSGGELSVYGYSIHFTEQELAPGHQYRLSAVAMQKDWDAALGTPGAKYRKATLNTGDSRQQIKVSLDRTPSADNPDYYAVSTAAPLDTLWHTQQVMTAYAADKPTKTKYHENADGTATTNAVETVTVEKDVPTYATVSLVRDTKHLNISLRELDKPEEVSADDYEVFIIDANGDVDYENKVVAPTDPLIYRPYAQWTLPATTVIGDVTREEFSAHYDLMFNRLMYNTTAEDNAVLYIIRKKDGMEVAKLNLPHILCQGRSLLDIYKYEPQEYLDREYDYRLDFLLLGGRWTEIDIHVLGWSKRIQYETYK